LIKHYIFSVGITYSLHDLLFDVSIIMPDLQSSDMRQAHIR